MATRRQRRDWKAIRMVVLAVYQLNDEKGSNKQDIQRNIRQSSNFRSIINYKKALIEALKAGLLRKKKGRFFPVKMDKLFSRYRHQKSSKTRKNGARRPYSGKEIHHSSRVSHKGKNSTWTRNNARQNSNRYLKHNNRQKRASQRDNRTLKEKSKSKRQPRNCKKTPTISSTDHLDGKSFPLSYFS